MNSVPVGPKPCPVTCPSCKSNVITRSEHKTTTRTHALALFMATCFCCLLCSCIPYCGKSCRNTDHYCPNCNTFLGTYKR